MATIDLTLNGIKIPALDGYTPPFGTKKISGGLTTQEVNDNVIAPFVKERPIVITEDSSTGSVEYNASLVINQAGATLTLGSGSFIGCEISVLVTTACSIKYTGIGGTYTDEVLAGRLIKYTWTGAAWFCTSCPIAIGDVYTQYPDTDTPAHLYGGQWEEHDYGGMFFRSAGGNAKAFTTPIAGSFSSGTVFAASETLPASVAAGDLVIAGSEYRTISSISGQNITIDSAFSNFSNITNLLIGQRETLPNISGYFANRYANITAAGAITDQSGAFYDNGSTSNAGGTIQVATGTTHVFPKIGFDANKGDSNRGIYKDGAHVQPNTISCKTWLRKA